MKNKNIYEIPIVTVSIKSLKEIMQNANITSIGDLEAEDIVDYYVSSNNSQWMEVKPHFYIVLDFTSGKVTAYDASESIKQLQLAEIDSEMGAM